MFGASILDDGVDQVIVPLNPSLHYNPSVIGTNQDPPVRVTVVVPPTDRDEDAKQEDLGLTELLLAANAKREAITLLKLSLPIVLSNLAQLFLLIPLTAAIGKLGTIALASMNLVSIYAGVGGVALLSGLPFALDSLCSQAYTAAKDRRLLGIYLQRILVTTVITVLSIIANSMSVIGIGFAVSACNRVGHLLGLGQPNRTLLTVYVTVGLATVMFMAMGLAVIASRSKIPGVFTPDAEVADILFAHIPWAAASGVVTGVNLAFNGILRGQGRQAMVARIRALSVVCIGFPLGAFSMYVLKWRLAGLWFGHLISLIVALLAQVCVVATTNWAQESENCQGRVSDAMLENGVHIGRASDL
ncbi:ethionine resistance protein [Kickxella alabastrina]|uniref:Ethionine resistance protein n=1 Tax=Kickxella alabastrina TaxID=61397 RepID=A0ACC1IHM0_9FUNG|nr:ethionine resistance protein [Kickxella alabastrina]